MVNPNVKPQAKCQKIFQKLQYEVLYISVLKFAIAAYT